MILDLPYTKPPLNLNDRMHWGVKYRIKREVRSAVAALARRHILPNVPDGTNYVTVQLHYTPRDLRRRDTDNLGEVLKVAADAIVDAGIVPDDTPEFMSKPEPIIDPPDRANPRLYLDITFGKD